MEQLRSFDVVSFEHDVLYGIASLAADTMSGLPLTVLAGLTARQTQTPSLSVSIAAGRIYQFASADAVAVGAISQDLTSIVQQGQNSGQILTFTPPSAGQSQWNLVQAQFAQNDAVRTNDPNNGIVPFFNVNNPSVPNPTSVNTVRLGQCIIQVITGAAATTGSEVPPQPTGNWVPLYLIDLVGGQTTITNPQILKAGPSVGTGVPQNYPSAPFLAGMLAQHHLGIAGHAPKIDLTKEVTGVLPYPNMSPVPILLSGPLTLYCNGTTGNDTNNGLSPSSAFQTIQGMINAATHGYSYNGFNLTLNVANDTYTNSGAGIPVAFFQAQPTGCPQITLIGNTSSPGSCTITATNSNGIVISAGAAVVVQGFTITATGASAGTTQGCGIVVSAAGQLVINLCVIGSCATAQCLSQFSGTLNTNGGPLTLTGTTPISWWVVQAFFDTISSTVTVTSLTVSTAFAVAQNCGVMNVSSTTFVGTATGPRYQVSGPSIVVGTGANPNYFPGSTAGSTFFGGQYT